MSGPCRLQSKARPEVHVGSSSDFHHKSSPANTTKEELPSVRNGQLSQRWLQPSVPKVSRSGHVHMCYFLNRRPIYKAWFLVLLPASHRILIPSFLTGVGSSEGLSEGL